MMVKRDHWVLLAFLLWLVLVAAFYLAVSQ